MGSEGLQDDDSTTGAGSYQWNSDRVVRSTLKRQTGIILS